MTEAEFFPVVDSRNAWVGALRWALSSAARRGSRRIACCDPDFAEWPLDDETLLQALVPWLKLPQRRLVLLARGYGAVPRRLPRFTAWRRDWVHAVETWQVPPELGDTMPTLLTADCGVSVQLFDAERWRGRASLDARDALIAAEAVDAHLQRSERAFPVSALGL